MIARLRLMWLRRRRDELQYRVHWIRDHLYSATIALARAERDLRRVQADLWCIEPIEKLVEPSRPGVRANE